MLDIIIINAGDTGPMKFFDIIVTPRAKSAQNLTDDFALK